MLTGDLYEVVEHGLRVSFLLAVPVVVVLSIAGTIITALQSATTIHDSSTAYAVRLVALVVVLYFMYPAFSNSLVMLAKLSWH